MAHCIKNQTEVCPCEVCVPDRELLEKPTDMVNHPPHYTQGGIEFIDAIEAALGREGFIAFLRGQVIKYQWRLGHKGKIEEDNAKAIWYADRLQQMLERDKDGERSSIRMDVARAVPKV